MKKNLLRLPNCLLGGLVVLALLIPPLLSGEIPRALAAGEKPSAKKGPDRNRLTAPAETAALIRTIRAVGKEGKGHIPAQRAYRQLIQADVSQLPVILRAFRGANPLAMNWLRSAVETIAERTLKEGGRLPLDNLEQFVRDRQNHPRARRLAFEWLRTADATRAEKLIPGFLDDPSPELRREAVQRLIEESKKLDPKTQKEQLRTVLRRALRGAVDDDQVKAIVRPLRRMGEKVDLQKHFGFLTQWHIIGPFDNRNRIGFNAVYPPEKEINLKATYRGQLGPVRWQPIATEHEYGVIDIAKSLKNYKGSVMYLTTEFHSARPRRVQFRLGTPNAWKLWVNGRLIFAREEYHRGMKLDQYQVPADLKAGRNVILFKILQNEQTQDWAQRYQFQMRICDEAGSAVLPGSAISAERE